MQVYNNIAELPVFVRPVITIGSFDGVHEGHVQILKQLVEEAGHIHGTPVVITFFPHPRHILDNQKQVLVLNTPAEKYRLLKKNGINHIVVVPFDKAFSEQSAESYISNFLVGRFHPHTIIIGYDHRFGNERQGDFQLLEKASVNYNFKLREIPKQVLQNVGISSTRIREALLNGDISSANAFLGYSYFLGGTVVPGRKLGRTLGYPTANISLNDGNKLVPALGIYAVKVTCSKIPGQLKGMMSIGTNPTVGGTERTLEVNLFDFDEDIYGSYLEVSFEKKLRNEIHFGSIDKMLVQIGIDKTNALQALD